MAGEPEGGRGGGGGRDGGGAARGLPPGLPVQVLPRARARDRAGGRRLGVRRRRRFGRVVDCLAPVPGLGRCPRVPASEGPPPVIGTDGPPAAGAGSRGSWTWTSRPGSRSAPAPLTAPALPASERLRAAARAPCGP